MRQCFIDPNNSPGDSYPTTRRRDRCGLIGRPRVVFRKQRVAGVAVGLLWRCGRCDVRDERYCGGYQCDDYNAAAAAPPFVLRAHLLGFGLLGVALGLVFFDDSSVRCAFVAAAVCCRVPLVSNAWLPSTVISTRTLLGVGCASDIRVARRRRVAVSSAFVRRFLRGRDGQRWTTGTTAVTNDD